MILFFFNTNHAVKANFISYFCSKLFGRPKAEAFLYHIAEVSYIEEGRLWRSGYLLRYLSMGVMTIFQVQSSESQVSGFKFNVSSSM